jgi:hypothetical protein
MNKMKVSSYPGLDGVPAIALKFGGPDIPILLLNLFNLSLTSGVVPMQWKQSRILPRHKGGPSSDIKNYRPINHIPTSCLILERIVKETLTEYLLRERLINNSQHGFLGGRSCNTCQTDFFDHITRSIENGQSLITLFLDIKKAFDRVSHTLLLLKLEQFGIRPPLLTWISSYLSNRSQVVSVDGYLSKPKPVISGVIQGSVLGPVLFLLFINDIFESIRHGKSFMFADDIKIVYTYQPYNMQQCFRDIQSDLIRLERWGQTWQLQFSAEKSQIVASKCALPQGLITLNQNAIPVAQAVVDLGLRYSCFFNFHEQSHYITAKAKRSIGLIHRSLLLKEAKVQAYKTLTRPILEFCPTVLSSLRKSERTEIEKIQRTFTKQVLGWSTNLNYRERCSTLGLDPLWIRRAKINLAFLFSIASGQQNTLSCQVTPRPHPSHDLRNLGAQLNIPFARTSIRYNSFIPKYTRFWNLLPETIRLSSNLSLFKKRLNEYLTVSTIARVLNLNMHPDRLFEEGTECL